MEFDNYRLLGAVAGDVIGSRFEWHATKSKDFTLLDERCFYTDDSILTVAVAHALLLDEDVSLALWNYANQYPGGGYGGRFCGWLQSNERKPYNSFGNGSAMRVSPVAWAFETIDQVLDYARRSAQVTHDHPEGIKGAQATALAILMARQKASKFEDALRNAISLGGDADTLAAITGSIAEAYFDGVPAEIVAFVKAKIPVQLWQVIEDFNRKCILI